MDREWTQIKRSMVLLLTVVSLCVCTCMFCLLWMQTGRITLGQLGEVLRTMDIDVESDEDVRGLLVGIGKLPRPPVSVNADPASDKLTDRSINPNQPTNQLTNQPECICF